MSEPKSPSRNHHYIPQSILRKFSRNSERIWVARRGGDVFSSNVRNVGAQRDLYTFTTKDGNRSVAFEQLVDDKYTDPALPIIDKLSRCESASPDDKATLAQCLALLNVRHPDLKRLSDAMILGTVTELRTELLNNSNYLREQAQQIFSGDASEASIELTRRMLESFEVKSTNTTFLQLIADLHAAPMLRMMMGCWTFLHAPPNQAFVRNERTIMLIADSDVRDETQFWKLPEARLYIPLTMSLALEVRPGDPSEYSHVDFSAYWVREYNKVVTGIARDFVVGPDEEPIRFLSTRFGDMPTLGVNEAGVRMEFVEPDEAAVDFVQRLMANRRAKNGNS